MENRFLMLPESKHTPT